MTHTRDWRSAAAYADAVSLPLSGWAWEFLRRNPDYRGETRAAAATPEGRIAVGRRWGLSCRRGPRPGWP
ncbi:transcriptional regulator domain-containing protein [Azospirillum doebereinerae]